MATKKAIFINKAAAAISAETATTIYESNSPSTCTVGGITAGTILTGKTMECLMQDMLAPYIEPAFSSFAVNITSPMEVGAALSGTKTFTWSTSTSDNVCTNSIEICEVGGGVLGTGLANDGAEALGIGTISNTSPQTFSWEIEGCSTNDNPFTRTVSKCSIYPVYYGVVTCASRPAVDNGLVNSGSKTVVNSTGTVTVDFNSVGQWTWVATPATSATKTCWYVTALSNGGMGSGGDKYPDVCTLDITSGDGCWSVVSYKVYMSGFAASDADPIQFRNS